MSLTKEQIDEMKRYGGISTCEDFSEQDLREAVGIEDDEKTAKIMWIDVTEYVFYWFNRFSAEFKHEARNHAIDEFRALKHINREKAIKKVNELIADALVNFIANSINYSPRDEDHYKLLQLIKQGKLNEFIDVDELIPFS